MGYEHDKSTCMPSVFHEENVRFKKHIADIMFGDLKERRCVSKACLCLMISAVLMYENFGGCGVIFSPNLTWVV